MRASQRKWSGKKRSNICTARASLAPGKMMAAAAAAAMPHYCSAAMLRHLRTLHSPLWRLLFEVCAPLASWSQEERNAGRRIWMMSTGDGRGRTRTVASSRGGRGTTTDADGCGWAQRGRRPTLETIHSWGRTSHNALPPLLFLPPAQRR